MNRPGRPTVYLIAMHLNPAINPHRLTFTLILAFAAALRCPGENAAAPADDAYRRAHAQLAARRYAEAAALFQTAAGTTNADAAAAAWLGRGEALYGAKQWDAAIAAYDTLLKKFPAHRLAPNALYARGFSEHQAGRLPQALATFTAFKSRYPNHAFAPACAASIDKLSRTLEAQSKRQAAEALTREVSAINALVREAKHAEAAEAARRFLQAHPADPQAADLRYLIAASAFLSQDYGQAVEAYRDFLARHPTHAQATTARFELGNALRALARYGDAADAYASATNQPQAAVLRAECLFKAGRPDEARKLYEAIARSASDPEAKANATLALGDCCAALQSWDTAERAYLGVEVLQGNDALRPVALARLADMYDRMGQPEKARITREELRRRYPNR